MVIVELMQVCNYTGHTQEMDPILASHKKAVGGFNAV